MGRWKYQNKKEFNKRDIWVRLIPDETKKLKIHDWQFLDNPDGVLFRASVLEEDGEAVDKFWTVWDYNLKEELKKKLKPFKSDKHKIDLTITKKGDDDDFEEIFDLKILTKKE